VFLHAAEISGRKDAGTAGRTHKINILEEMESMKRITLIAAIALSGAFGLAGCAGQATKGDDMASYEAAKAAAVAEQKKANKMGGEWRDTGKFLKQADKAAKAGDFKKAMSLINKVKFQAEMGQKQAAAEAGVGNPDYLK
jgi:hypothetical protein